MQLVNVGSGTYDLDPVAIQSQQGQYSLMNFGTVKDATTG
jgi:hypothetical protein